MNTIETKESFSVLIPDGESPQALGVLRCLAQMKNVKVYILSSDARVPIRFSRYSNQFFSYANEKGDEGLIAAINDTVKKVKVDIVLPVDAKTIGLLSANSGNLSQLTMIAPLPTSNAFKIANNKWLLSEWLKNNKIPCPTTILYQTNNSFDEALTNISFPVLIKPSLGGDGNGIKLFDTPAALYSHCKEHIGSGDFIIQSFINGYDIDCSILCREGKILAYSIQKTFIKGPRQFGPSVGIDFLYDECTYNVVKELAEKFKWSGVVHIDLRYDEKDKQVKVIEMNPRFWASVLGSLCAGVNFPYLTCLAGLKRDLPKIEVQPKRFVQGKVAIKILAHRLLYRNRKDHYFDNSSIQFILKDPIPNIIERYYKIYKKVVHKKTKKSLN
ncbi:MAG: ATP-grasp domain-containing protein [Bacteroidia bacterium]|nr:ATP-grasp domain-containing protein [Bacteroidia bacterium]